MLLRSQTLPFLLFQTSVSILPMFIQPLAPYVNSGSVVFLDFQTGLCYLIKDCNCCCHSSPISWPVAASRVEWMFFSPVALIKMSLSGCTKIKQQLCLGGRRAYSSWACLCLSHWKWEIKPNISIRGPLWWIVSDYSWFSHSLCCLSTVCGHATLRDPILPTLVNEDNMMNGYADSSAHQ